MSISDDLTRSVLGLSANPMEFAISQMMHVTAIDRYGSNIGKDAAANTASYSAQIVALKAANYADDHPLIKQLEANIQNERKRADRADARLDNLKQPSQGGLLQR